MMGGGRRNLDLILADDMGLADLGCMGSEVRTPMSDKRHVAGDFGPREVGVVDWPRLLPDAARMWGKGLGLGGSEH